MNQTGTTSHRHIAAWLAFLSAFGILVIVIFDLVLQLTGTELGRVLTPAQTQTSTSAPTKFAIAVASATPSPSHTPTVTSSPTSTPTRKPTPSNVPTRTPTATPTAKPSAPPTVITLPNPTTVNVGEEYSKLSVQPSLSDHSAAPVELNIVARGFAPANVSLGLVDIEGPADAGAPQLYSLFADERTPVFSNAYQIHKWDWNCNCRGELFAEPEATLISFAATPGEIIRVPRSSYYIGNDFQALVLYADGGRVTFNYTRTGNPVRGYTIYLEGIAVDAGLIALYQQTNDAGRVELPALRAGQAIGRAQTGEIKLAIRDAGAFMDPRSRKDWWRGR